MALHINLVGEIDSLGTWINWRSRRLQTFTRFAGFAWLSRRLQTYTRFAGFAWRLTGLRTYTRCRRCWRGQGRCQTWSFGGFGGFGWFGRRRFACLCSSASERFARRNDLGWLGLLGLALPLLFLFKKPLQLLPLMNREKCYTCDMRLDLNIEFSKGLKISNPYNLQGYVFLLLQSSMMWGRTAPLHCISVNAFRAETMRRRRHGHGHGHHYFQSSWRRGADWMIHRQSNDRTARWWGVAPWRLGSKRDGGAASW